MIISRKQFSVIFLLILFERETLSEFRFCYHGPHKFSFQECPGGIALKKPVASSCTYFAKGSNIGDGRVSTIGDVCNSSMSEDVDIGTSNPTHTFALRKIQEVSFEGDMATPTEGVDTTSQQDCVQSCFSSWVEPEMLTIYSGESMGEQIEPVYHYPTLTDEMRVDQEKITEQLFMKLILDEMSHQAGELRVAKLLRASFIVMSTHCPHPYITQSFINKTLDAFFFFSKNSKKTIKDIGVREYLQMMNILAQCRTFDTYNSFRIIGKNCSDFPTILGGEITYPNGTTREFVFTGTDLKLDPFIESSWQAIAFVNAHCFRHTAPEFNLHHVYEVAMEALFSEYILLRWVNPPEIGNVNFWNNLMGTPNFQVEVQNINTCTKLAYVMNPYTQRLERPFKRDEVKKIKSRAASPGTPGEEDKEGPADGDGWLKTEEEYWAMYKSKGGIKQILSYLGGTCFASESERETLKGTMMTARSGCSNESE